MGGLNMKLIKPSFEIWEQEPGLEGIYKQIERAGRICYRSENKITEDSAKPFIDRLIKSRHLSVLEHGTVYLSVDINKFTDIYIKYLNNKYTFICRNDNTAYITSNFRVLVENNWLDDLKYLCEPTEWHKKRVTVHFTLDRSTANEYVRHRVFSFAQESQRYCNYSLNKYDNNVTFIKPCWIKEDIPNISVDRAYEILHDRDYLDEPISPEYKFCYSLLIAEDMYLSLLKDGWKPQEARAVLPNACKTELVMTGFASDWQHFFELRDDNSAHPQAQELAHPLHGEFVKRVT